MKAVVQKGDVSFSPHERERLAGCLKAMQANRISLRKRKTGLFPFNLSVALFVHLTKDPVSGLPRVLGYRAVDEAGDVVDAASWAVAGEEESVPVWEAFSDRFLKTWKKSIGRGKGPHLFHFGEGVRQGLREWGERAGDADRLSFLWKNGRVPPTDLRSLMRDHFFLPAPGRLTLFALGRILGFSPPTGADNEENLSARQPESLFHDDPEPVTTQEAWARDVRLREEALHRVESILDLQAGIWKWAERHIESDLEQAEWGEDPGGEDSSAELYLRFLEDEKRVREEDILALQDYSLAERIERFRAMGPLTFLETSLDEEGRFLYTFLVQPGNTLTKFREDDFLKLVPVGSRDLQGGLPVILARYRHGDDRLSVLSRQGRLALSGRLTYSLEEDLTDWNHPKLVHVVREALSGGRENRVTKLLDGRWSMGRERQKLSWIRNRLQTHEPLAALNLSQRAALELPFRKRLALIEGPPGTGKTHLLGWIIVALMLEARESGEPLRIAVSALTHRAIDGVLRKVVDLVTRFQIENFSARVLKWGRWKEDAPDSPPSGGSEQAEIGAPPGLAVRPLSDPEEIPKCRYLVLGATGFGLDGLCREKTGTFPPVFDWIVFDEASQILVPQALLSLVYGKGRFLFLGDVKQLPPVILGSHGAPSILELLLERYGPEHRVRLNETYRMNKELCAFPSTMWYEGTLQAAPGNAHSRLQLSPLPHTARTGPRNDLPERILDPEKPVVLVLADHRGCHQKSDLEAEIVAQLACRLMLEQGVSPERLAIISPHRAQNNAIAMRLRRLSGDGAVSLPVVDTVERLQGAERDVILFSTTTSDPDHMMSGFLNNPHRFNVAITRARLKLIVVGSRAFFLAVPQNEEALQANRCFKEFVHFCREREALFVWREGGGGSWSFQDWVPKLELGNQRQPA